MSEVETLAGAAGIKDFNQQWKEGFLMKYFAKLFPHLSILSGKDLF